MSQFIVSARKYRPRTFGDVVGQDHITTTLKNAIRHNKVAHAFLFCGPRGVGKTTTARILAKTINCENITDDFEACGNCNSCISFQKKNAPNIIELDAASHNSVEDIRTLNEQVRIPPAQGNYKLFIIDEVHMLSTQAFNAFLKTLEEPPASAIFILATTEKHKILPTILSRCQIYDFKRSRVRDIVPHLVMICNKEGIDYDEEALHLIAEKADGALRDALSIFDRMVSFSSGHITYDSVIDQLNILDHDYFFRLTDMLITGDLSDTYLLFDTILEKGFNPEVFLLGFQEHLRQLLMVHLNKTAALTNASSRLQERYISQAGHVQRDFILTMLDLANECDVNYRLAQNKRLHVEIYLMKMAYFPHLISINQSETLAEKDSLTTNSSVSQSPEIKKNTNKNPTADASANVSAAESIVQPKNKIDARETVVDDTVPATRVEEPEQENFSNTPSKVKSKETTSSTSTKPQNRSDKKGQKSKILLPTLNKMDEIMEEVKQDEAQNLKEKSDHELSDHIQNVWDTYAKNHTSPSLVSYLKDARLALKDDKIHITVTSQLAKSSILDQRELFEDLRNTTAPRTPEIVFEIDSSESPVKNTPKPLSTKDKYEALKKTNPNLDYMIKELNLKIDDF